MPNKTLEELNEVEIFEQDEAEDESEKDIREAFDQMMADDDEDDGGFDAPLEEDSAELAETVSAEEGAEIAAEARTKGAAAKASEDAEDTKPEDEDASETSEKTAKDDKGEGPDYGSMSNDDLLGGIEGDHKEEVSRRLSSYDELMGKFDAHKEELERHGGTPAQAIDRFLELNKFASEKPDEYVAWVLKEVGGDNAQEALQKAASHLGLKVSEQDSSDDLDDDEMFMTDRERELIEENRRLRGEGGEGAPSFGPDTPDRKKQREVQDAIDGFLNETDDDGNLVHGNFDMLSPRISQLAAAHKAQTNQDVTIDTLREIYAQADQEMRDLYGGGNTSAATQETSMTKEIQTKAAASAKAKRASKSVDGTGQGASHRPALPEDASLEDTIRHFSSLQS
ncbi:MULTISPECIES: hypothetical protein [Halocynthiibacter]|uniref:Uncharacterized protein n=1 Tax=Halocynthiibacter halioticoli TaxID=2986804 RepID=A0AAE3J4V7_9RHOB|nr:MULTISPECIES: hypothetical protein [Halocynthiibacter]MCV6826007.1 hypothetical protein [Halocynthiibacter halioticoli]MCW4059008.1 hypothetical protein [Halocynthiibacter sp. SDUM655004]